mgnify:CR=1 FL=1
MANIKTIKELADELNVNKKYVQNKINYEINKKNKILDSNFIKNGFRAYLFTLNQAKESAHKATEWAEDKLEDAKEGLENVVDAVEDKIEDLTGKKEDETPKA